jgi:hypothetical protein
LSCEKILGAGQPRHENKICRTRCHDAVAPEPDKIANSLCKYVPKRAPADGVLKKLNRGCL